MSTTSASRPAEGQSSAERQSPAERLAAARARYRAERDKRLRKDGNDQYLETKKGFADFVQDPYATPHTRAPVTAEHEVVIVGGGFGGILSAIYLMKQNITDICILDKAGGFGGTWYWNRYPGISCDMQSYIYLPLLEETGYMPPRNYASGEEIRAYSERMAKHWGLAERALFQTELTAMEWDEDAARWQLTTQRGDRLSARFVILALGVLDTPKLPGIKGIEQFRGHMFHTGRWDYAYTGGNSDGGLVRLADKRVGIIGTGATSVQCVPHLAEHAKTLHVFQRTPSGVDARPEHPTDANWYRAQKAGWQRDLVENFTAITSGGMVEKDLVQDGWTGILSNLFKMMRSGDAGPGQDIAQALELADLEKMDEIRARIDTTVRDAKTAEALKPWYRQFCKRPCFHDTYLESFNRPNVTLVDTDGRGVEAIDADGVRAAGQHYALDCLIFASGFEVGTEYVRRSGFDPVGRKGQALSEKWAGEIASLHGIHVHGFPNCFIHQVPQSGLAANFVHTSQEVAQHVATIIVEAERRQCASVEATAAGEAAWVQQCRDSAGAMADFFDSCTPGYYNREGQYDPALAANGPYGGGPVSFFNILKAWRDAGDMPGLILHRR